MERQANKLTAYAETELEKANQQVNYWLLRRPGAYYSHDTNLSSEEVEEKYDYWLGRRSALEDIAGSDNKGIVELFNKHYGLAPADREEPKNSYQRGWLSAIVDFYPLYVEKCSAGKITT